MEALVIVHVGYRKDDELYNTMVERIVNGIADETKRYVADSKKVYYLRDRKAPIIPKPIRKYQSSFTIIPDEEDVTFEEQFLQTKQQMMVDGVSVAKIVGISLKRCVRDLNFLLNGKENPDCPREEYMKWLETPEWSEEEFERVYEYRIESSVLERLAR